VSEVVTPLIRSGCPLRGVTPAQFHDFTSYVWTEPVFQLDCLEPLAGDLLQVALQPATRWRRTMASGLLIPRTNGRNLLISWPLIFLWSFLPLMWHFVARSAVRPLGASRHSLGARTGACSFFQFCLCCFPRLPAVGMSAVRLISLQHV